MQKVSTLSETRRILEKYGFQLKKRYGQNFLIDQNVLHNIVAAAGIEGETVVEIGPGIGALTQFLADKAKKVVCFEIDYTLKPVLKETLGDYPNVDVIFQDILKTDISEVEQLQGEKFHVVANLPYYITTPIIEHLLKYKDQVLSLTIMMQKEVAERIKAEPNTKTYGSLSVFLQAYFNAEVAFIVPKTVFVPKPDVDSAILKLTPKEIKPFEDNERADFEYILRALFATRRKTINNNLGRIVGKEKAAAILGLAQIDGGRRAETLRMGEFVAIMRAYRKL